MRRLACLLVVLAAGCSTAPVADALDFACPPRVPPQNTPCFGGVGVPQAVPPPAAAVQPPVVAPLPVPPAEQPVPPR